MTLRSAGFLQHCMKPFLFVLLALLLTEQAAGQQRPPPDSVVADSLRTPPDSAQADSVQPPPIIVKHSSGANSSLATGVWEWSAEDLLREGAISLNDLLQRIPGATPIRSGLYLQPEIASPFGHTRDRIEVLLDGMALDPLTEATLDLASIELAQIRHVRIERRLDVTRIELSSLEPVEGRPVSRIEAGVGEQPDANLFRGLFLVPRFLVGPVGFAVERKDTDGYRARESADDFSGWVKWAWLRGQRGIQAELRQTRLSRGGFSLWPGQTDRRDIFLRARSPLTRGLVGELFFGRSTSTRDTTSESSVGTPIPEGELIQWGGRASFDSRYAWVDATARFRDHQALPSLQIDALAGARLGKFGALTGAVTFADWRAAGSATSYDVRLTSPALLGLSAFVEIAGGKRGGPSVYFADSINAQLSQRSALRTGLAFQRWGINASAAMLQLESDSVQTFGLPFDATDIRFPGTKQNGLEFAWSLPLYWKPLSLHGHYTRYSSSELPIYLPRDSWQVALQLHTVPLPSRNLEVLGRLEMRRRGVMRAPQLDTVNSLWSVELLPAYHTLDAYLQIRIIDVRLFLRLENMRNQVVPEIPGRLLQSPRFLYGVKWSFFD